MLKPISRGLSALCLLALSAGSALAGILNYNFSVAIDDDGSPLANQIFTGMASFPDSTDVGFADFLLDDEGGTFMFDFVEADLVTPRTYTEADDLFATVYFESVGGPFLGIEYVFDDFAGFVFSFAVPFFPGDPNLFDYDSSGDFGAGEAVYSLKGNGSVPVPGTFLLALPLVAGLFTRRFFESRSS